MFAFQLDKEIQTKRTVPLVCATIFLFFVVPIKNVYCLANPCRAIVPGGTDIRRNNCNVKSIAPRRTVINNLILTTMTHISKKIGNFAL